VSSCGKKGCPGEETAIHGASLFGISSRG
jgi:hypothetical protein